MRWPGSATTATPSAGARTAPTPPCTCGRHCNRHRLTGVRRTLAVLPIAMVLLAPPTARAASCPRDAVCGRLTVPLDHSGAVPGSLSLTYARLPATGVRTGTIAVIPGGPGQAAIPLESSFRVIFADVRPSYDLLFLDPRGTGASAATDCGTQSWTQITACGVALGDARPFLTTNETVADLEDLRRTLGEERLTLYGVSYGTHVAAEYARRFPSHTAAVVLDAPTAGSDDAFDRQVFAAMPRVLRQVCTGRCARTV